MREEAHLQQRVRCAQLVECERCEAGGAHTEQDRPLGGLFALQVDLKAGSLRLESEVHGLFTP